MKVAQAEGKDMKQELLKFLLAYRSTPEVTTSQSLYV